MLQITGLDKQFQTQNGKQWQNRTVFSDAEMLVQQLLPLFNIHFLLVQYSLVQDLQTMAQGLDLVPALTPCMNEAYHSMGELSTRRPITTKQIASQLLPYCVAPAGFACRFLGRDSWPATCLRMFREMQRLPGGMVSSTGAKDSLQSAAVSSLEIDNLVTSPQ